MLRLRTLKLLFSILIASSAEDVWADTVDFYSVSRAGITLLSANQFEFGKHVVKMDVKKIASRDSLTVRYFRDTPCEDCRTFLTVENEQGQVVLRGTGKGTLRPISISLERLKLYHSVSGKRLFHVCCYESSSREASSKRALFQVSLE